MYNSLYRYNTKYKCKIIIPHFIMPCTIALHMYCEFLQKGFYKKVYHNPVVSQTIGALFPRVFTHFVFLSHVGNSYKISNAFIIIVLVRDL